MDLDELLGIDLANPSHRLARLLASQDEDLLNELVAVRKASGKSQQDVADAMGISQSAVARIEAGERDPHLSTLRRYAHAVGALVTHSVEVYDHAGWRIVEASSSLSDIPESVVMFQPDHVRLAFQPR
jgi:transcriptional regulator with XRE-family HTH domain